MAKNTEEEIALEKQKRHKELIDTLNKLVKSINSGGGTAEPVKESSFLDDMWAKLRGLADLVSLMRTTIVELAKKIGMKVAEGLSSAGRWAVRSATAFATSGAAAVTAVGAGGALLAYGATNVLSNMSPEMRQQLVEGDKGSDTSTAAAILNSAKSEEELASYEDALTKYRAYMNDAPFTTRMAAALNPAAAGEYLRNVAKIPKKDLDLFESFDIIPKAPTAEPVKKKENAVPQAPEGQIFDAEGNLISGPKQTAPVTPKPPPSAPTSQQVPAAPRSAQVSNLTNNNLNMNLPVNKADNTSSVVNKTVNNVKNVEGKTGLRPIEISVRNDEPTFMGLIIDSTRMI